LKTYIELTISFLIGRKRTVNFWNHTCDVISLDYTIIMSRTLKVTGNHVMCDRGAWFLRVIMSSLRALCCLPSVKKQNHDFHFFCSMYNNTILLLDSVFVISRIIKVSVRVISLCLRLQLISPTSTLIILEITKTSSNNNIVYNFPNRPIAIVDNITSAKKGWSFTAICCLWLYKVISKNDAKFTYPVLQTC